MIRGKIAVEHAKAEDEILLKNSSFIQASLEIRMSFGRKSHPGR
jgi:hypothetical protein